MNFLLKEKVQLAANHFVYLVSGDSYSSFDEFSSKFERLFGYVKEIYNPPLFTRVGLRKISRQIEPKDSSAYPKIKSYYNPILLGPLLSDELGGGITETLNRTSLVADSERKLNLQYGLQNGTSADGRSVVSFYLDFDCYTENSTNVANLNGFLKGTNEILWSLFNWSVTEPLKEKMRNG
jgi:uncharacterized protein (TIGR04255 family)